MEPVTYETRKWMSIDQIRKDIGGGVSREHVVDRMDAGMVRGFRIQRGGSKFLIMVNVDQYRGAIAPLPKHGDLPQAPELPPVIKVQLTRGRLPQVTSGRWAGKVGDTVHTRMELVSTVKIGANKYAHQLMNHDLMFVWFGPKIEELNDGMRCYEVEAKIKKLSVAQGWRQTVVEGLKVVKQWRRMVGR